MSMRAGSQNSISMRRPSLPVQGTMIINHANATRVNTVLFHSLYERKAVEAFSDPALSLTALR